MAWGWQGSQDNVKEWRLNWRVSWCSHFPLCPCYERVAPAESPLPWTPRMRVFHHSLDPSLEKTTRPPPCEWKLVIQSHVKINITWMSDIRKPRGPVATAPCSAYHHLSCQPSETSSWSEQRQLYFVPGQFRSDDWAKQTFVRYFVSLFMKERLIINL